MGISEGIVLLYGGNVKVRRITKKDRNVIYKMVQYVLVLYAVKVIGLLGIGDASFLAFAGMLLFTWFFLDYTNKMMENVCDPGRRKCTICFSIIFELILFGGIDYTCRKSGVEMSALQLIVLLPGIYMLVYRTGLLTNAFWGVLRVG